MGIVTTVVLFIIAIVVSFEIDKELVIKLYKTNLFIRNYIRIFLFFRKEMGGDLAHVAIAVQGAPAGSPQSLALAVAARGMFFYFFLASF